MLVPKAAKTKNYCKLYLCSVPAWEEITVYISRWQLSVFIIQKGKPEELGLIQTEKKAEHVILHIWWKHLRSDEDGKWDGPSVCASWLRCLLAFITSAFILMHWFAKLNIQSEWPLSPTDSSTNWTCPVSRKAANGGLTSANGAEHTTKLRPTDIQHWLTIILVFLGFRVLSHVIQILGLNQSLDCIIKAATVYTCC